MSFGVELAYAAAAIASAAGTAVAVQGQRQQAKAATASAVHNNRLAQQQAALREREQQEQSRRTRENQRRRLARIRVRQNNSGILSTTGTPLAIISDTQDQFNLAISDAKRQTDSQAAALRSQGQMGLWEADQYGAAANTNALAAGISGVTSLATMGANYAYRTGRG